MKSKHGLLNYIDEKFYNKEHPENRMIKIGDDRDSIELHISGRWKRYENGRAIDYVLINIGNDFNIFMEILRDEENDKPSFSASGRRPDEEDYEKNKKLIKVFQNNVMVPLEWANINKLMQARLRRRLEISEDGTQQEKVLTLIKNKAGEIVIKEDEDIMIRRDGIKGNVLEHIYNIKEVN